MKTIGMLAVGSVLVVTVGCASMDSGYRENREAVNGAVLGTALGTGLGLALGNNTGLGRTAGALGGAALGGLAGGYVGDQMKDKRDIQQQQAQMVDQMNSVTVNIKNSNGSISPVIIRRVGPFFVGPRGEYYSEMPTEAQLEKVYSF
jgi:uncharacterized membrane protein YebE (DUF533 family)